MRRLQPRESRPMGVLWEKQCPLRGIPEKASMAERERRVLACGEINTEDYKRPSGVLNEF